MFMSLKICRIFLSIKFFNNASQIYFMFSLAYNGTEIIFMQIFSGKRNHRRGIQTLSSATPSCYFS